MMDLEPYRSTGGTGRPRDRILSDYRPHHGSRPWLEPEHLSGESRVGESVSRLIEPKASDVWHFGATTSAGPSAFGSSEVPRVRRKDVQDEVLEASQ